MSYKSSHKYETVYILKSGIPDNEASAIHQKVDSVVEKFGGKVLHRDDWGLTPLAYPINDETMGRYTVVNYQGKGGVVAEIERHFKILPEVIRYITVQVAADYDYTKIKKQMALAEEEIKKNREVKEQRKRAQQQAQPQF